MQIISNILPVDDLALWCAGMVVLPKSSDTVRICVDLVHLNQNVLREYHLLLNFDDSYSIISLSLSYF